MRFRIEALLKLRQLSAQGGGSLPAQGFVGTLGAVPFLSPDAMDLASMEATGTTLRHPGAGGEQEQAALQAVLGDVGADDLTALVSQDLG